MGALCSLVIFIFLMTFSVTKLQTLILVSDVDIIQASEDYALTQTERFSSKDGFFIAAALTKYDKDPEPIEQEEFGELVIEQYGWGNEDLGYEYGSREIPNHQCSNSELGLTEAEDPESPNVVYPIVSQQFEEVKRYSRKFKCI